MPGDSRIEMTVHVATAADLPRLGRQLGNCLATYGQGRTSGRDRIVEVRRGGAPLYAVHLRDGRIVTFEGVGNRRPDARDVPLVRDLLRANGLLRPPRPRAGHGALSLQALATELLANDAHDPAGDGRARPSRLEWPEFAAALWATGWLAALPDPDSDVAGPIVRDLAERIATGEVAGLPRRTPPAAQQRREAAQRLRPAGPPRTRGDFARRRMAAMLAAGIGA